METMASWLPSKLFAEALFWAWLLQPEDSRTPPETAQIVRRILGREIRSATEDVATFDVGSQR